MMIRAGRQLMQVLLFITMLSALSSARLAAQWVQAPPTEDVVIRGGWLFDGIRDTRVRNTGIVIRGGVLAEVGAELGSVLDGRRARDRSGRRHDDPAGDGRPARALEHEPRRRGTGRGRYVQPDAVPGERGDVDVVGW